MMTGVNVRIFRLVLMISIDAVIVIIQFFLPVPIAGVELFGREGMFVLILITESVVAVVGMLAGLIVQSVVTLFLGVTLLVRQVVVRLIVKNALSRIIFNVLLVVAHTIVTMRMVGMVILTVRSATEVLIRGRFNLGVVVLSNLIV
jgi:hypothetical protein